MTKCIDKQQLQIQNQNLVFPFCSEYCNKCLRPLGGIWNFLLEDQEAMRRINTYSIDSNRVYYIYIYYIHKYTVSSFNYSVTISEHTQDLHRAPIPKSPSQDSGIVGLLLCRDLLISSVLHAPSQYMTSMPTPKREYSRKCMQHSHIRVMRTMQAVLWCFLGLHITGASRLQSPCKRSWRLPRLNSVELMRLGPQQNHAFILSVGDVQGRMCMTNLFGWPGSSCRKEMGSEAR